VSDFNTRVQLAEKAMDCQGIGEDALTASDSVLHELAEKWHRVCAARVKWSNELAERGSEAEASAVAGSAETLEECADELLGLLAPKDKEAPK
jgi:hypothetical protein